MEMTTVNALTFHQDTDMDGFVAAESLVSAHTFDERMAAVAKVEDFLSTHPDWTKGFVASGTPWHKFSGRELGGDPRVRITGLRSTTHLNGQAGFIMRRDPAKPTERLCV